MWINVALLTDAAHADALSEALMDQGAVSVSVEDALAGTEEETPQFGEPGSPTTPLWEQSRVIALFEPGDDLPGRIAAACHAIGLKDLPEMELEEVEEQNWVQLTQSQFDPIRITDKMWIVPSWHMDTFELPVVDEQSEPISSPPSVDKAEGRRTAVGGFREAECGVAAQRGAGGKPTLSTPSGSSCILQLDPGMAFGTGSHPTTFLCLQWLCDTIKAGPAAQLSLLDYGCGSGILAIAAAKLGAGSVLGVDIDEKAIESARYNAERNQVSLALRHSSQPLTEQFDIVVANILTNPLCVLAPLLSSRVATGGRLVLSGVLESQAQQVIDAYAPYLPLQVGAIHEGWCRLEGTSKV